jgi:hypothetical protein
LSSGYGRQFRTKFTILSICQVWAGNFAVRSS